MKTVNSIKIDDTFSIVVDTLGNHTLMNRIKSENNKKKETTIYYGFFRDYATALKKYAMVKVLDTKQSLTIDSYIKRFESVINEATERLIKEIKK